MDLCRLERDVYESMLTSCQRLDAYREVQSRLSREKVMLVKEVDPGLLQEARDAYRLAVPACNIATDQAGLPRELYDDLRRSVVHTAILAAQRLVRALEALEVKG